MQPFRYFLPMKASDITPAVLTNARLDVVFFDVPLQQLTMAEVPVGPTGRAGTIIHAPPISGVDCDRPGYYPKDDRDHWRNLKSVYGKFEYSIGYDTESKPTAQSLRRRKLVSGYDVQLGDGRGWHCPTARRMFASQLPYSVDWNSDGEALRVTQSDYIGGEYVAQQLSLGHALLDSCWENAFREYTGQNVHGDDLHICAVKLLQLNYRLGHHEAGMLGLLTGGDADGGTMGQIIAAGMDEPFRRAVWADPQKKTGAQTLRSDLLNSLHGQAESIEATDPALQTSGS